MRALVLINTREIPGNDKITLAGPPLALLDVVGMSPLQRTVEHLKRSGILQITSVIEANPFYVPSALSPKIDCKVATSDVFWRTCENVFHGLVQNGAELVLIIRLGAYAEIDVAQLVEFHVGRCSRVTRVAHATGAPEIFCISASRRNDAAALFRSGLSKCRTACSEFPDTGYVNPLRDIRDFRQFAVDVLTLQTKTTPAGRQARPGVWIAARTVIESGSRILAPAFVGLSARVRAGALLTRCTAIEHHAQVDCGTVVENSTVLPHCYVGAGLDLAHSVVGMGQVANLRRSATVEITDSKLIGRVFPGTGRRLMTAAGELLSRLGRVLVADRPRQPELRPALRENAVTPQQQLAGPQPAQNTNAAGEFASPLVAARRYGDD